MDNRHLERAARLTEELADHVELINVKVESNVPATDTALVANLIATEKTNSLLQHIIELLTHPE